jgi:hypothetical protein
MRMPCKKKRPAKKVKAKKRKKKHHSAPLGSFIEKRSKL